MAGQIIKRGHKKYLVKYYLGEIEGKQKYRSEIVYGPKEVAERRLIELLNMKNSGIYGEPSKQRLAEYLDEWEKVSLKPRVSERTFNDYRDRLRLYIRPSLGSVQLRQLKPEQIQAVLNDMTARGLSARTVTYTCTILKNALAQAVKWQKLYKNPADAVDLPKQRKKEMQVLDLDQVARFLKAAAESPWKAFFTTSLATGARPGELLALKWSDVDLERGRITINRSLVRNKGKGWSLEAPKTNRSRRTIPLPAAVVKDLKELKARQKVVTIDNFVFTAGNGAPGHEPNIINRHFKPLLKKAGLPDIRLYDLRHSCATLLLGAGVNPKVVAERLGHANISMTLDTYSHVLPDMQEAATEKLEGIFNGQ